METLQINPKLCLKCGICAGVCGDGLIEFQQETYPKQGDLFARMCISCGACVVACPSGALTHKDIPTEKCPQIQSSLQISAAQCEQFLRSRRSIRAYKDLPVHRSTIQQIIEIARYAPTGHNSQRVEWKVIDNKEILLQIEMLAINWFKLKIQQDPQLAQRLDFLGLLEKQEKSHKGILRGAPVLIIVHAEKQNIIASIDCVIALTYLDLVAKSMGLGACWTGLALSMATSFPPVQNVFDLPEGHQACGCMILGYPKYNYVRLPARKEPKISWCK
jgi:nitroreductase/NAD-dependent dihydropyrimidine dehydrogenase PreA subunit